MVNVQLFGLTLLQAFKEHNFQLELPNEMLVKTFIEANPDTLGQLQGFIDRGEVLMTVNRKVGSLDSKLKDGDVIKITHQFNPVFEGARWQNP